MMEMEELQKELAQVKEEIALLKAEIRSLKKEMRERQQPVQAIQMEPSHITVNFPEYKEAPKPSVDAWWSFG